MNVIFLDFDGVIDTNHYYKEEDVEKKIEILSYICASTNSVVVIEAGAKDAINEETMEIDGEWVEFIFKCFKKYNIKCIGRTPNVEKRINEYVVVPMWKEDEIIRYLEEHPEIEHFCIIDDDDHKESDLNKVRNHLVKTIDYSDNPLEEGLLPSHLEEVKRILSLDNEYRKTSRKM